MTVIATAITTINNVIIIILLLINSSILIKYLLGTNSELYGAGVRHDL